VGLFGGFFFLTSIFLGGGGGGVEGVLSQLTIEIGEVPVKGRNRKREIGNKIMTEKGIFDEAR
jgi:hypothetical protein